jgi:hypothetical protein
MKQDPDPLSATAVAGNSDGDRPAARLEKPPELGGAAITEDGVGSTREHRRHPTALVAQPGVANRVDASMDAVNPACIDSTGDSAGAQSGGTELRASDYSVLARCELGEDAIGSGAFCPHTGQKAPPRR